MTQSQSKLHPRFRKKGQPHLFDALQCGSRSGVASIAGTSCVIVIIGDGLDRGSKTTFDKTVADLQVNDITVYMIQIPDRTRGAIRRDVPKPDK